MAAIDMPAELLDCTAQIVSAHVARNTVPVSDVPDIISKVYQTLKQLNVGAAPVRVSDLTPAVPIRKSVYPGYIICLEDGKKLKMLRRHLKTVYGMTPDQYRQRWGLPATYPMVAPAYAERRSSLAKAIGLGNAKRRVAALDEAGPEEDVAEIDDESDDVMDDAAESGAWSDDAPMTAEAADAEETEGDEAPGPDLSADRVFANFHANTNTNARPTAEHGDDETQPAADMKSGRRKRLAQRPAREMQAPRNTGRR